MKRNLARLGAVTFIGFGLSIGGAAAAQADCKPDFSNVQGGSDTVPDNGDGMRSCGPGCYTNVPGYDGP